MKHECVEKYVCIQNEMERSLTSNTRAHIWIYIHIIFFYLLLLLFLTHWASERARERGTHHRRCCCCFYCCSAAISSSYFKYSSSPSLSYIYMYNVHLHILKYIALYVHVCYIQSESEIITRYYKSALPIKKIFLIFLKFIHTNTKLFLIVAPFKAVSCHTHTNEMNRTRTPNQRPGNVWWIKRFFCSNSLSRPHSFLLLSFFFFELTSKNSYFLDNKL